jgi:hypothetical protein
MGINFSEIQDVTDAEMLKMFRWAMTTGAAGQTRSINGRTISFPPIEQLRVTIEWLERRIDATTDTSDGIALIQINPRS